MGYQTPIVCKEMYLSIEDGDSLTFDGYKNKYGIDLKEYVKFDESGDLLYIPPLNTKVYAVSSTPFSSIYMSIIPAFGYIINSSYEYGASDAVTTIGSYDSDDGSFVGIVLLIPKGIENPTLDDVVISKINL